jgi:hypothetical protein
MHTELWFENGKGTDQVGDPEALGRITLEWILEIDKLLD